MNPANKLKSLIADVAPAKTTAVISAVEGSTVYVVDRGQSRAASILPGDISSYKPGDTVRLEGGVVLGKDSPRKTKFIRV